MGMHSDWACNGKEAILRVQYALKTDCPYQVYFLDKDSPELNGLQILKKISISIQKIHPLIYFMAYDSNDIEAKAKL